jgi:hypothetical protein
MTLVIDSKYQDGDLRIICLYLIFDEKWLVEIGMKIS